MQHDRHSHCPVFHVEDRAFVYMPAMKSGPAHKFARPYKGPYRVVATFNNGDKVYPVDRSHPRPIRVALNRVRCCPAEIPDVL